LRGAPGHAVALFQSGKIAFLTDRPEIALDRMTRAVRAAPRDALCRTTMGIVYVRLGRTAEAVAAYEKALAIDSKCSHAYYHLAAIHSAEGRVDEAVHSYRRTITVDPNHAPALHELGNLLAAQGRRTEALDCYKRALAIKPGFFEAHERLAALLWELRDLDAALDSCRRALTLNSNYVPAHITMGNALMAQGKLDAALDCYQRALRLEPGAVHAHFNMGTALHRLGRLPEALAAFKETLRFDPANAVARHLVSALGGEPSTAAPNRFVELLFDDYAAKFETHVVQTLNYRIPELLGTLIGEACGAPARRSDILDLGCGTGLAGAAVAPYARKLVGVDLSAQMLAIAAARGIYERLEQTDLLTMMQREPAASYDAILAADVFIYVGRLESVVAEMRRLLRPGGVIAFSVEALEAADEGTSAAAPAELRLNPTARYSHSLAYIRRLAEAHMLRELRVVQTPVRTENGTALAAWVVVWVA
jgi:predicted TPR repeat methyltransferase